MSLECSRVCVVDGAGKISQEAKVASEPEALIAWFRSLGLALERIGLEAGPLSQWLYAALREANLAVELLETRHVRDAFKAMPVKSDRNDARGIAQLMRLGWFRPVHCKSMGAQETRALLTARKLVQTKLRDVENSLRGILRGFGLKVGKTTERSFTKRIGELVANHASLEVVAEALLSVHAVLLREFKGFEKQVRSMSRSDAKTRLLMSTPAVGPIVALTYASAIDDPARFKSSKQVGAHFGLTPKKYQSGETDYTGRISKIGDASVRTALYAAAHIMLIKPVKGCSRLKSWAMRIARRAGMNKAKVALARKLAVILHQMLVNGNTLQRGCGGRITRRSTTVFGRVTIPGLLEARSLRRDDGSGQAVRFADWDGTFSETSFGFRPGRSAHQAVERAQAYIASGHAVVVDIDLTTTS